MEMGVQEEKVMVRNVLLLVNLSIYILMVTVDLKILQHLESIEEVKRVMEV